MEIRMQNGGQVWVSEQAPHWKDWRGKQAYKFYAAQQRARRLHAARQAAGSSA